MPAAAIPTKRIAVHGRVGSNTFSYMRNPTNVATSAATDPNVTASNMRPEIPRSLPPSVSAGLAATGTRATSARTSGTSATVEVVETSVASAPSAGWISTRRESNNFSATASSTSGASSGTVSGSACTGADFERSIRSSRRASTFVVEEASLRAYPQAPQNAASAELGAPQTGQGLPGSSLIVNGSHPYREPINVSTWVPSVRAFFPPRA